MDAVNGQSEVQKNSRYFINLNCAHSLSAKRLFIQFIFWTDFIQYNDIIEAQIKR